MYITHMHIIGSIGLPLTGMINFSNSEKVEMYGNGRAVLLYILLSSNYPMARSFPFVTIKLSKVLKVLRADAKYLKQKN